MDTGISGNTKTKKNLKQECKVPLCNFLPCKSTVNLSDVAKNAKLNTFTKFFEALDQDFLT